MHCLFDEISGVVLDAVRDRPGHTASPKDKQETAASATGKASEQQGSRLAGPQAGLAAVDVADRLARRAHQHLAGRDVARPRHALGREVAGDEGGVAAAGGRAAVRKDGGLAPVEQGKVAVDEDVGAGAARGEDAAPGVQRRPRVRRLRGGVELRVVVADAHPRRAAGGEAGLGETSHCMGVRALSHDFLRYSAHRAALVSSSAEFLWRLEAPVSSGHGELW